MKLVISFFIAIFLYTSGMMPLRLTKSFLFIPSSVSYAILTQEEKNDALQDCIDEHGATEASDCAETIDLIEDEMGTQNDILESNDDLIGETGASNYDSIMILVSTSISLIGSIAAIVNTSKFVSNWLSAAAAVVVMIWYIWKLVEYHSVLEEMAEQKVADLASLSDQEKMNDIQITFLQDQIAILQKAIPINNSIQSCFSTASWLSGIAGTIAVIEAIACVLSWGGYCAENKTNRPGPVQQLLNFLFLNEANAQKMSSSEVKQHEDEAKETVGKSPIGLNIGAWTNVLKGILFVVAGNSDAVAKLWAEIVSKGSASKFGKSAPFAKIAFFGVDVWTYISAGNKYKNSGIEINRRITILNDEIFRLQAATDSTSGLSSNGNSISSHDNLNTTGPDIIIDDGNDRTQDLGANSCNNFDMKTAELKTNSDCQHQKNIFPKAPKLETGFLSDYKKSGLSNDPNEYLDDIEKGVSTKEGIQSSKYRNLAKKAKKLKSALLKLARDKKLILDPSMKNKKDKKKGKPLYEQMTRNYLKQKSASAAIAKEILKNKNGRVEVSASPNNKNKNITKKAFDDIKPKKPKYSIGSLDETNEEDEGQTPEDLSLSSLDEYKDSAADIIKKPGVSIWKVISVRYKKSAYDDLLEKRKK